MESCLDAIKSKDDMMVEMFSGLGIVLGKIIMPKIMKKGLIEAYFESGAVKSIHLYIDGKEITDGINYNQYAKK